MCFCNKNEHLPSVLQVNMGTRDALVATGDPFGAVAAAQYSLAGVHGAVAAAHTLNPKPYS